MEGVQKIYYDALLKVGVLSLEVSNAITFIQPGFHSLQWDSQGCDSSNDFLRDKYRVEPTRGETMNDQENINVNAHN